MAMRNTLLVAAGFIALMIITLVFFGGDNNHGMMISQEDGNTSAGSIDDARKAYWARDFPKAERIYRILSTEEDVHINVWGELGNLYYMQARWQDAAKAYTEVTLRLIKKKDMRQAAFFHRLVNQMDRAQSERINKYLRNLQTKQEG